MRPVILSNGLIINNDFRYIGSIVIRDGQIADTPIGRMDISTVDTDNYDVIDCQGKMIIPGVIDDHVHFREPGLTEKGDIRSETRAALAGGVTSFFDMPNTIPQTTTIRAWQNKMERAADVSAINYAFYMGATNSNISELLRMDTSRIPGVKLFMGSSTGDMLVDDQSMIRRLFESFHGVIAVHAESNDIIRANTARLRAEYGDNIPLRLHSTLRSREACIEATRQAVELARATGARLHVAHITTADELQFFSSDYVNHKFITSETCPHYLIFNEDSVESTGGLTKCNPAIKTEADRRALLRAVADGVIDTVATDHAPHQLSQKRGTALTAASGMPSIQFSLPLMMQLARDGHFSYETVVRTMCSNPATIFGVNHRGFLRSGYWADITIIDPDADITLSDDMVLSRCGWTPYAGRHLSFAVEQTWVNGVLAYNKGQFTNQQKALPLNFN